MRYEQTNVIEFMQKAGQEIPTAPAIPNDKVLKLRIALVAEELMELADSFGMPLEINPDGEVVIGDREKEADLVKAYDAILDLMVVVIGTGVSLGLDLEPGWSEVHLSNMAKFAEGGYRRADGKWMKPPGWQAPDLKAIIERLTALSTLKR